MMPQRIKFADFVESEITYFKESCNFSPEEEQLFDLRVRHKSMVEIQMEMHISESKATALSKSAKNKILKVL